MDSTFVENTEFVLSKIDSVVRMAMPTINKAGEGFVMYFAGVEVGFFIVIFILVLIGLGLFLMFSKRYDWDNCPDNPTFVGMIVSGIITVILIIITICKMLTFLRAWLAPEIFTIMKVIEKL